MNVLLIEGQELTREFLLHLLIQTFPHTRVTALATIDEIASGQMPYEAILLGMDSIQGIEKTLSWLIKPDATLIIQMSSRLNEPGAGVRVSKLKLPEHLIWENDQQAIDWPTQLVHRVRGHFVSLEVKRRIGDLYNKEPRGTTSELHWIFRAAKAFGQFIEVASHIPRWLPPPEIQQLMERSKLVGPYGEPFSIRRAPLTNTVKPDPIEETTRAYAEELKAAYESLIKLGRISPEAGSIQIWLLPVTQKIQVNFQTPFLFYRETYNLVFPVKHGVRIKGEEIRRSVRFLLACLFNHSERPEFSQDWDWFDHAIAHWFASREDESYYLELPGKGTHAPFYDVENVQEGVRFVQSLEGQLGARGVFRLWRAEEHTPMHAFAREGLVDRYFDWLPKADWDYLADSASPAPSSSLLDDCSCSVWLVPSDASYVRFKPSCRIRVKACLLRRFDSQESVATLIPPAKEVRLPQPVADENRLLMVTNIFSRPAWRVRLRYQLDIHR